MPYGNPNPQMAASRSYCERCANLPENIMAVLELQCKQLAEKRRQVKDPITTVETPPK
jgi:hypothetical protein